MFSLQIIKLYIYVKVGSKTNKTKRKREASRLEKLTKCKRGLPGDRKTILPGDRIKAENEKK